MSKAKQIRDYLSDNPNLRDNFRSDSQMHHFIAEKFNTVRRYVATAIQRGNKSNSSKKIAPNYAVHSPESKRQWEETKDGASLDYIGETPIRTTEQAIEFFDIDIEKYEIDRFVTNSWDVTMKIDVWIYKATGKPWKETEPFDKHLLETITKDVKRTNYQFKAWFKKTKEKERTYFDIRDELIAEMIIYSPKYPNLERQKTKDPSLLVLPLADLHVGKYSKDYNISIAEERADTGVSDIIERVGNRNLEKIVLIGGNDMLHTENGKGTTSGTPQDTDGLWDEHYRSAKNICINAIEKLVQLADVHYVHAPCNHAYRSGFMLSDSIMSWFHAAKNVSFDVTNEHRKYVQYGISLIGITHGDGAKEMSLPDLMKTEAKKAWAESLFGYWYCAHVHHKDRKAYKGKKKELLEKDYMDVMVINSNKKVDPKDKVFVEYCRSMGGSDRWHGKNGYKYSPMALESYIHHPNFGQTDRVTVYF